ncbi:Glu/Leu/Phe/Val dehydrogenase dimerization domain-containing protein [Halalkalibacterium halodurans]|uniref:Leucine dehydrogenase n=1 Tax=Halalkalibacterium halodurans TaxID=86665 RepID=A0A0M0KD91_ALKHA|nr:Glu/Leu/Phe/Val dehydrogenase dimerization domain-containing protein [Halalkalibacterium halodurans]MDY7220726.1 Glu/Leu/Phe/Val dehydrogenase dimerization domain-containing protein [Halalkalibacterium halodurans]MDY7239965.1 Glu/Leu/Phe/Val dehydrogenase dimerization domain-containing protein [Halalkalibacterium halodurans]MED4162863.1 Glu/Leu/Phe/Val dehydrogenase dimerization domain-containing protein [Halalkalibacterium halodurans]TPE68402.1 Glu/Leu/Phe/Val dehydrogenase [Halalkalibacter
MLTKTPTVTSTLDIFTEMAEHEQVLFCHDPSSGLRAIIAIHDTTLGPALGGCRMYPYQTTEDALRDVLRLSKGMTQKCAAADVDFGGGKAVIIGDPAKDKSANLFRAFGQFVESLNGRFYTGTDMGTTMEDFVHALKETNGIVGIPKEYGGSGDSSVPTAKGVINSLKAISQVVLKDKQFSGRTYAIQGLGKVGFKVAEELLKEGNDLYVSDLQESLPLRLQQLGQRLGRHVEILHGDEIYEAAADVFVPCAQGAILNDATIARLKVKAIAGAANNQLEAERHGQMLHDQGIWFAPDYIVNSGGLIQVADELYGSNEKRVLSKTNAIYDTILEIFHQAERHHITTLQAANQLCERRIRERARRNNFFVNRVRPKWNLRK